MAVSRICITCGAKTPDLPSLERHYIDVHGAMEIQRKPPEKSQKVPMFDLKQYEVQA